MPALRGLVGLRRIWGTGGPLVPDPSGRDSLQATRELEGPQSSRSDPVRASVIRPPHTVKSEGPSLWA